MTVSDGLAVNKFLKNKAREFIKDATFSIVIAVVKCITKVSLREKACFLHNFELQLITMKPIIDFLALSILELNNKLGLFKAQKNFVRCNTLQLWAIISQDNFLIFGITWIADIIKHLIFIAAVIGDMRSSSDCRDRARQI